MSCGRDAWVFEGSGGVSPSLGTAALKIRVAIEVGVSIGVEYVVIDKVDGDVVFGWLLDCAQLSIGCEGRESGRACAGITAKLLAVSNIVASEEVDIFEDIAFVEAVLLAAYDAVWVGGSGRICLEAVNRSTINVVDFLGV